MSVAICNSSTVSLPLEKKEFGSILIPSSFTFPTPDTTTMMIIKKEDENQEETPPRQLDIWTSIQSQKTTKEETKDEPYVHPLVRRSSSLLSQKSLEICTESLGSETGSDQYVSSGDEMDYLFSSSDPKKGHEQVQNKELEQDDEESDDDEDEEYVEVKKKELTTVNYHCSIGRRSPPRSFPPPLPSISNRGGPCFQMRPHRKNGRLVVQAVAVPSQNYLHSERQDGRLVLSFIETKSPPKNTYTNDNTKITMEEQEQEEVAADDEETMEMEYQEEEEEVEVVDRGTVVEVKVSTQATKVHRSSIVINKFVSCTLPSNEKQQDDHTVDTADHPIITTTTTTTTRRTTTSTTTAAAAAVAASSLSTFPADGNHRNFDNKLLFTSKRRNSEELLRDMRRCNQLRKPLFIWEPCCIATSS